MNFGLIMILMLAPNFILAQDFDLETKSPSPKGALFRSFVIPGWGHHYIDKTDWKRGQYHLAADVVMILSYAGLSVRGNLLQSELETFAKSRANTEISSRNREFQLAVSSFDNFSEYNDYQLRSRNWDNLLTDTPENQWDWDEDANRVRFQDMRERVDKNNNQLPTIVTLMVLNRVTSGLSAYTKARNIWKNAPEASFSYLNEFGQPGITARLNFEL